MKDLNNPSKSFYYVHFVNHISDRVLFTNCVSPTYLLIYLLANSFQLCKVKEETETVDTRRGRE